jgi:hypothetical protein
LSRVVEGNVADHGALQIRHPGLSLVRWRDEAARILRPMGGVAVLFMNASQESNALVDVG